SAPPCPSTSAFFPRSRLNLADTTELPHSHRRLKRPGLQPCDLHHLWRAEVSLVDDPPAEQPWAVLRDVPFRLNAEIAPQRDALASRQFPMSAIRVPCFRHRHKKVR